MYFDGAGEVGERRGRVVRCAGMAVRTASTRDLGPDTKPDPWPTAQPAGTLPRRPPAR